MILLSMICGVALQKTADTAADFFPLIPGTVRTYESKSSDEPHLIDKVGAAMDMGGPKAYPVTETPVGRTGSTTYYRLDADQVVVVANDPTHPLPNPMPILKLGTGKTEWSITGATMTGPAGERLLGRGEAHAAGQRIVLGKKVDVIEVKLNYEIGVGMTGLVYDQKLVYARGIGLVEITSKVKLGKGKPTESSYKLISLEPPTAGSAGAG